MASQFKGDSSLGFRRTYGSVFVEVFRVARIAGGGRKDGDVWLLAVNPTYRPKVVEFALEGGQRNRSVSLEPLGVWFGKIRE